ncbi:uncharacterized protein LOC143213603 [Lasioglossum baleicum]|uniref:uncharacterized protein LOC143213603 n=1 Tax=Lasioglossum baleicum TaxID=434251 RepID=UPI003FCC51D2
MFKFSHLCRLRGSLPSVIVIRESQLAGGVLNRSVVLPRASLTMSSKQDIWNYFEFARDLTLKAGEIFKRGFEGEKNVTTKKSDWDLVTDYDKKIEELLFAGLKEKFPDHEFIGEESAAAGGSTQWTDKPTWIIDPIDGTVNYVNSFPHACISVGLTICKEIVVGIIYNPMANELYTAVKGGGAFLNGKPMKTSNVTELKKALVEIDVVFLRSTLKNRDIRMSRFEALIENSRGIRCLGSAALGLAYVAKGALDCFQMDGIYSWDVAAGVLLIREAGGSITSIKSNELDLMKPDVVAAASETLAMELKNLMVNADLKAMRKRLTRS